MGDIKKAISLCDEIIELVPDLPERAESFGASIEEKVLDMKVWIEKNDHVTETQIRALENMLSGVNRWLHDA